MSVARISALLFIAGASIASAETPTAELWSLEPIADPAPPQIEGAPAAANPIDAFIAAAHQRHGASRSPPASRSALIRRASYDLTGLPPDPGVTEAFVADPRPDADAFREVVEDLLASRHYGERWGRHWLDVVRYADTAGENSDHPIEDAWRYRNWVIDAFNADKPYDRFVHEQLAGDILAAGNDGDEIAASIIATGYLAIARRFGHRIEESMHLTYEDTIDNLGKAFLGLSISCARCHDHKHDPISTRDYYSLYSVFDSTRFPYPGCEPNQQPRDLVALPVAGEFEAELMAWEQRRDELKAKTGADDAESKAIQLRDLAAQCHEVISQGDVADGGSVLVTEREPIEIDVRMGEAIHLSILPQQNYGADTTILDYTIEHSANGAGTKWSPSDMIDDLLASNPHPAAAGAQWCFLDTTGDMPKFLTGKKDGVQGKPELKAWENGAPPSVLVNTSGSPVKVWTSLPPRTFYCHPGPKGPVAIAWLSPIDGKVAIHLKVGDGHPGGDGVGWRLEHFADPEIADAYRELAATSEDPAAMQALADHMAKEPMAPVAYAVAEGEAKPARVHRRGDHEDLGDEFPRQYLSMLGGGAFGDGKGSGRLELAQRITSPDNPLAARVMVNRIWAWHFGRGLVTTTNDFGHHGTFPTHPELLDHLASRFIESSWSVKAMHRLIMNSATYRQAAGDDAAADNYAAFGRRRLTAEELRDTLLVAGGLLDRAPGKAHPFPAESTWGFTQHNPFAAEYPTNRRSVYVMRKRNRATPFFALFDGADPNASTAQRGLTTVPTQALYFMNDPFFHDCAEQFAARVRAIGPDERVDFVCRELFGRPATEGDRADFEEFAKALAPTLPADPEEQDTEIWKSYSRILMSSNEFLFLD